MQRTWSLVSRAAQIHIYLWLLRSKTVLESKTNKYDIAVQLLCNPLHVENVFNTSFSKKMWNALEYYCVFALMKEAHWKSLVCSSGKCTEHVAELIQKIHTHNYTLGAGETRKTKSKSFWRAKWLGTILMAACWKRTCAKRLQVMFLFHISIPYECIWGDLVTTALPRQGACLTT